MPKVKLSSTDVEAIKRRIYYGDLYDLIAEDFDVGVSQISNIACGNKWADIPWPDKTFGALSDERKIVIARAREVVRRKIGVLTRAVLTRKRALTP